MTKKEVKKLINMVAQFYIELLLKQFNNTYYIK